MDQYGKLLVEWCDSLLSRQIRGYGSPHDGGFLCDACTVLHGRADNAIFPLVYLYAETGEARYLKGARLLLGFRRRLTREDGSVYNDGQNFWKATTVFSAIGLYKTLHYCAGSLPEDFRQELERLLAENAGWIYENLRIGYASNINYYAAGAAAQAACGNYFDRADYRTPDMRPIREFLSKWYGESYAELLLKVNPRRILENRPVLYEPSPERRRKRRWFV